MAAMSTAMNFLRMQGNKLVYALTAAHTLQRNVVVEQSSRNGQFTNASTVRFVADELNAGGEKLRAKQYFDLTYACPVDTDGTKNAALKAAFKDFVASDEFDKFLAQVPVKALA